jgi:hypothetical protein
MMAYIHDGIPAAGEEQAPVIGEIETQDALLVCPDGEYQIVCLQGPSLRIVVSAIFLRELVRTYHYVPALQSGKDALLVQNKS